MNDRGVVKIVLKKRVSNNLLNAELKEKARKVIAALNGATHAQRHEIGIGSIVTRGGSPEDYIKFIEESPYDFVIHFANMDIQEKWQFRN